MAVKLDLNKDNTSRHANMEMGNLLRPASRQRTTSNQEVLRAGELSSPEMSPQLFIQYQLIIVETVCIQGTLSKFSIYIYGGENETMNLRGKKGERHLKE